MLTDFPNRIVYNVFEVSECMNRIKQLREERDWKQSDLALRLSVKDAAISKYENEKVPLTADTISKICKIFECSSDYLLGLSNIRACKNCPLTVRQGDRIVQRALDGSGLLSADGSLAPGSEEIISDFLARNADMLKKLIQDDK